MEKKENLYLVKGNKEGGKLLRNGRRENRLQRMGGRGRGCRYEKKNGVEN